MRSLPIHASRSAGGPPNANKGSPNLSIGFHSRCGFSRAGCEVYPGIRSWLRPHHPPPQICPFACSEPSRRDQRDSSFCRPGAEKSLLDFGFQIYPPPVAVAHSEKCPFPYAAAPMPAASNQWTCLLDLVAGAQIARIQRLSSGVAFILAVIIANAVLPQLPAQINFLVADDRREIEQSNVQVLDQAARGKNLLEIRFHDLGQGL